MEELLKQIINRLDLLDRQLDENTQLVKALLHRTEELNAITTNLGHTVAKIEGRLTNLEERMTNLEERMTNLEERMTNLEERMTNLEERMTNLEERMTNLEERVTNLEERVTNIEANMATKKDLATLDAKFEVLNSRLFHQEAELYKLKAVK